VAAPFWVGFVVLAQNKSGKTVQKTVWKPHFLDTLLRSSNPIDENFETKIGCATMSWVNRRNKIISKGTCDGEK
jgi:hypothetical protein